jgi:hypothetical protein
VDCGAEEPAVDEWEKGIRYPSFEQLKKLAELTGFGVGFFIAPERGEVDAFKPGDVMFICYRGRNKKQSQRVEFPPPVLRCKPEAIAEAMKPHYEQDSIF